MIDKADKDFSTNLEAGSPESQWHVKQESHLGREPALLTPSHRVRANECCRHEAGGWGSADSWLHYWPFAVAMSDRLLSRVQSRGRFHDDAAAPVARTFWLVSELLRWRIVVGAASCMFHHSQVFMRSLQSASARHRMSAGSPASTALPIPSHLILIRARPECRNQAGGDRTRRLAFGCRAGFCLSPCLVRRHPANSLGSHNKIREHVLTIRDDWPR